MRDPRPLYAGMRLNPALRERYRVLTAAIDRDGPTPCAGRSDMVGDDATDSATEVCRGCPVADACLDFGRASGLSAIWGGVRFGIGRRPD